ncbi:hypothetical protein PanWU01x14_065820 [Parasponia andersonii]|uniref:Uncharacterized protein n=1 Tax=Parasponia andersonii TaxID=3476 RepID=A0A2P5DGY5_PARAD|nr:hypothetical protein PanWU01x14_065820 [Parasponia andersonii]
MTKRLRPRGQSDLATNRLRLRGRDTYTSRCTSRFADSSKTDQVPHRYLASSFPLYILISGSQGQEKGQLLAPKFELSLQRGIFDPVFSNDW